MVEVRLREVWRACAKLRDACARCGLDLRAVLAKYDPAQTALITPDQFYAALSQAWVRARTGVSLDDLRLLAEVLGRVQYLQLCAVLEPRDPCGDALPHEAIPELDLRARATAAQAEGRLDTRQKRRLHRMLRTLAARDQPLEPRFQHYLLATARVEDGAVETAQFLRTLSALGVPLSVDDSDIIVKYFERDPQNIDLERFLSTYRAFIECGEAAVYPPVPPEVRARAGGRRPEPGELVRRVQRAVAERRMRVAELFPDWDPLRRGRVTRGQFARALDELMRGTLTPEEAECLAMHYADPNVETEVCWKTFEDDIERVAVVKELEKWPDLDAERTVRCARENALRRRSVLAPLAADQPSDEAFERVRAICEQRTIHLRNFFTQFDPLRCGRVTATVLQRVLSSGGVSRNLTQAHVAALEARYSDENGYFDYNRLLCDIDNKSAPEVVECEPPGVGAPKPRPVEPDVLHVLTKLKDATVREGKRLEEFARQFDRNRERAVRQTELARALDATGFGLTQAEVQLVCEAWRAPGRPGYVRWLDLHRDVHEALTQDGLERAPLLTPVPHVPVSRTKYDLLTSR